MTTQSFDTPTPKVEQAKQVIEALEGKSFTRKGVSVVELEVPAPTEANPQAVSKVVVKNNDIVQTLKQDLPSLIREIQSYRKGSHPRCVEKGIGEDVDFAQVIKHRYGYAPDEDGTVSTSFLETLGLSKTAQVESFVTLAEQDPDFRWLIPEIFLDQVRLGVRAGGLYRDLIAAEVPVSQKNPTVPAVNMSDAMAKYVEEGQTIQLGSVSFGAKTVKIRKMGRGISLTDEATRYCALNLLGIFLEDYGVRFNQGLDTLAIQTLINGDQIDGSDSTFSVGVNTVGNITYRDLLRIWMRTSQMGSPIVSMLMEEDTAGDIFELDEFKLPRPQGANGNNPSQLGAPALNIRNLVPPSQNVFVHGVIPAGKILMTAANSLVKLNAVPLNIEEDRDASKQITNYYVSVTTGFATTHRERRLLLDKAIDFSVDGFPSIFDIAKYQRESLIQ